MKQLNDAESSVLQEMWLKNPNLAECARAVGRDRRTVKSHLVRAGIFELGSKKRTNAPSVPSVPSVPAPGDELMERAKVARGRLWDVLNSPNSPGQAIVAAFNALAESEGWAGTRELRLPEPATPSEIEARFVALFESYPAAIQAQLRAAITR